MIEVKPGDVVFHSGRGVLAHVIKRVTGTAWSHVSMVVEVRRWDFTVLDVLEMRVVQSISEHFSDHAWHVRSPRYPVPGFSPYYGPQGRPHPITRDHVVRHALELHQHLPRHYPYLELAAYVPFLRRTDTGRRILRRTDRLVCSAMVAAAWHSMDFRWYNGPQGTEEISPDWVDPGTMWHQANRDQWPLVCTKESFYA